MAVHVRHNRALSLHLPELTHNTSFPHSCVVKLSRNRHQVSHTIGVIISSVSTLEQKQVTTLKQDRTISTKEPPSFAQQRKNELFDNFRMCGAT